MATALFSIQGVLDGRPVQSIILATLCVWLGWRISYCGLVVTHDELELRSLARTTRVALPVRGRVRSTVFGSLVVEPAGRRRIIVRSVNSYRRDPRVADLLHRCGFDVSAVR